MPARGGLARPSASPGGPGHRNAIEDRYVPEHGDSSKDAVSGDPASIPGLGSRLNAFLRHRGDWERPGVRSRVGGVGRTAPIRGGQGRSHRLLPPHRGFVLQVWAIVRCGRGLDLRIVVIVGRGRGFVPRDLKIERLGYRPEIRLGFAVANVGRGSPDPARVPDRRSHAGGDRPDGRARAVEALGGDRETGGRAGGGVGRPADPKPGAGPSRPSAAIGRPAVGPAAGSGDPRRSEGGTMGEIET